jgi:hypothetical protein
MKRIAFIAAAALAFVACEQPTRESVPAPEAPDRDAILETVDTFFLAMAEKDSAKASAILAPGARMVAIGYGERAGPVRRSDVQGFVADFDTPDYPERVHEDYWDPTVLQRADLAVVWTPYRIDIGGERLHCGIDVFNLSREDGNWLIYSISFTMEPDACPELEPENVVARPVFSE